MADDEVFAAAAETRASLREANLLSHTDIETEVDPSGTDAKGFGEKTITFWGSFCLNLNNVMGPAMVLLPLLNQRTGWFVPTLAMILLYVLSSAAATMLCEAMQRIPGNFNFQHRYEFATVVQFYYGRVPYIIFQLTYNLSMQASNIAAMIISAQVMDSFIQNVAGHSYALNYQQYPPKFIASDGTYTHPWKCEIGSKGCPEDGVLTYVISLGFIICMAICIPFGYLNLDENMWFQWFSLAGLALFTLEFIGQFIYNMGREDKVCVPNFNYTEPCTYQPNNTMGNYTQTGTDLAPAFKGSFPGYSDVLGLAVFAYAYIVTIPSWVNEKKHHVNINKAVWYPATVGLVLKVVCGLLGAWAYWLVLPNDTPRPESDDILNILTLPNQPKLTIYSAYLWDITTLIPGIPVLAIMVRYNLLSGKVSNRFWSFFWGVVFPWIVTMFCYETNILTAFCNWIAIVLQGFINFVVPAFLYRTALKRYPDHFDREQVKGHPETVQDEDTPGLREYLNHPPHGRDQECSATTPLLAHDHAKSIQLHRLTSISDMTELEEEPVNALPPYITLCGRTIFLNRVLIADIMIITFSVLSVGAIAMNIAVAAKGES
eukprot:m.15846 g.15846  ORF g.15846 m.15846 type:complete len:601 (-) comp6803_c0_seq2:384-2186(-)